MKESLSVEEVRVHEQRLRRLLEALSDDVRDEQESLEASGEAHPDRGEEAAEEAALDSEIETLQVVAEERLQVVEALDRITAGTFGMCTNCRRPIERARLDLVPYAHECAECAAARERSVERAGSHGSAGA